MVASDLTNNSSASPLVRRFTLSATAILVLLLALRPISNDDLWWQLSRGRAVFEGVITPSQSLLAGDLSNDADWLSGLPFFVGYSLLGVSGLMILKLAAACGLAAWCWRLASQLSSPIRLVFTIGLTVLVGTGCDPSPALWDMLGLLLAGELAVRSIHWSRGWSLASWAVLAIVWANLGPLSILILLPLLSRSPTGPVSGLSATRNRLFFGFIALAGLCLTPRGWLTPWDSLRQLVPILVETHDILRETDWRPVWDGATTPTLLAWFLLSSVGLIGAIRNARPLLQRWPDWLLWLTVQSLACWSQTNLVVLSVWLLRWAVEQWSTPLARNAKWLTSWPALLSASVVGLMVSVVSCCGEWPFEGTRLGWGLNRRLDLEGVADSLGPISRQRPVARITPTMGTAHCTDVRAAGMLVWSRRVRIKPYLVPQRALLNGRLREEGLLNRELTAGWLRQHQRSDGSAGGWWPPLRARNALLLVISAERTTLIRNLEHTIWKPLSFDTPVIAYALAGYPLFDARITEVASQMKTIDRGPWVSQPNVAKRRDNLVDGISFLTAEPDPTSVLRESAVLRAMNLPLAAMRVLRPVLSARLNRSGIRRELVACQIELSEREWLTLGRVGELRRRVLEALEARDALHRLQVLAPTATIMVHPSQSGWSSAIDLYLQGQPHAAAALLTDDDAAMMAGRAMLEWEAGEVDESRKTWTSLLEKHPDTPYAAAGHHALESGGY